VLAGLCVVALIGGAATVVTTAKNFSVPGLSMENTIKPGDIVLVDRTAQVHRGDVIVDEESASGPGFHIRRVIGLPGDHVACCDARGRMTVNGKALDETYLYPGDEPFRYPGDASAPTTFGVTVPAGKLWLMGDHRSDARDSRMDGALAIQVVGRVFLIARPGHLTFLGVPQAFAASGLAPASEPAPAPIIGLGVVALALVLLLALTIFGIIRHTARRRGWSRPLEPQPSRQWWDQAQL
jgi:signal peptidase I